MFIAVFLAEIGMAWLFIRYLIRRDRGPKEPPRILFLAGVFGVLATIGALLLESHFLPSGLIEQSDHLALGTMLGGSLLIGLFEEGCKSLPLALFIYKKGYFNEVTDGLIYFGIAGMSFGLVENIGYEFALGPSAGLARLITAPFIHAGFCVIFGWLLARRKALKSSWLPVVGGFAAEVGLHGIYDFGIFYQHVWSVGLSLAITISVNLAIFKLYGHAERLDRRRGLSTHQHNWYCPHCGAPNPKRYLFCTRCGQKT